MVTVDMTIGFLWLTLLTFISQNFDTVLLIMFIFSLILTTTKQTLNWLGRKFKINKRLKSSRFKEKVINYLSSTLNRLYVYSTNRNYKRRSNDRKINKKHSSLKVFSKPTKILTKRGKKPFLLLAWSLLEKTPMYSEVTLPVPEIPYVHKQYHFNLNDWNETETHEQPPPYIAMPSQIKEIKTTTFDTDSFKIGIDTHATACMSNTLTDFVNSSLIPYPISRGGIQIYGKGPKLRISKTGTLKWNIEDDQGRKHKILIPNSIFVPDGTQRLLSPQHFSAEANKTGTSNPDSTRSIQYHNRNVLYFGSSGQYKKTVFNTASSNVPTFYTAAGNTTYTSFSSTVNNVHSNKLYRLEQAVCYPSVISDDEQDDNEHLQNTSLPSVTRQSTEPDYSPIHTNYTNEDIADFMPTTLAPTATLIEEEQEHIAATSDRGEMLRWHYRLGHLSFSKIKLLSLLNVLPRKLALVKPPRCACCIYGKMTKQPWRTKAKNNRKIRIATAAGHCVSVDQMESSTLGFIGQLKGRLTISRYKYATVFIDNYSRYKYVYLQRSLTSKETLNAKIAFEAHSRVQHVQILNYHADNGRFVDNDWVNDATAKGQTTTYCGVNAHWQNGIAEKGIRDLREHARTSLLHAMDKWPSAITTHLWPYALRHAAAIHNSLPRKDGRSAIELFSNVDVAPNLKSFHTFGCPVYALDNRLQANQPVSSWLPRARLGLNLGQSPRHARNISLVLNLNTGLVSPQFHIKHDEFFETISRDFPTPPAIWIRLAGLKRPQSTILSSTTPVIWPTRTPTVNPRIIQPLIAQRENQLTPVSLDLRENEQPAPRTIRQPTLPPVEQVDNTPPPVPTRSTRGRLRLPSRRLRESIDQGLNITSYSSYYDVLHEEDFSIQDKMTDPIAFKASTDPDTMYYHEAMAAPDRQQFITAIIKEVNAHIENNHWALVPIEDVPQGTKILDSIWAMKRKRDIKTQEIYKHKARLNIHGGQQEYGIHYTETYSPVVNWFSVRLIMILSIINKWHTRQIDFVLAYPQAPLEYDNYMKLPHGITTAKGDKNSHVLKLHKNIYGGKNSGRIWNEYLTKGLKEIGFTQSKIDECVFYRGNLIFLCYVDDGIFAGPNNADIDQAIKDLADPTKAKATFNIEDQGDIADYLGINFEAKDNGLIKLSQPHLIDQIIKEVGIKPTERKSVPASPGKILRRDEDAETVTCPFNYRKVIGKLNFLEKSSRPDIAYATHQCARFCSEPKQVHIDAVIYLTKYLQNTRNEGILLDPKHETSFEVYADADFAGNWFKMTAQDDPSTAKSRSGYVIMYGNCPILWGSKLQTCISLSTTEAEYVALSQSLRDTIPIMNLIKELQDQGFHDENIKPVVHCKAFEDNTGALELSKVPKMRPRTKHINNVYHHFRSHVRDKQISIFHVSTEDQLADMFTKPLPQNLFLNHRKRLLGF